MKLLYLVKSFIWDVINKDCPIALLLKSKLGPKTVVQNEDSHVLWDTVFGCLRELCIFFLLSESKEPQFSTWQL